MNSSLRIAVAHKSPSKHPPAGFTSVLVNCGYLPSGITKWTVGTNLKPKLYLNCEYSLMGE